VSSRTLAVLRHPEQFGPADESGRGHDKHSLMRRVRAIHHPKGTHRRQIDDRLTNLTLPGEGNRLNP